MSKILLCDFDDSFTYNIYVLLVEQFPHVNVEVLHYDKITYQDAVHSDIFVLGPGPGNPSDYKSFLKRVSLKNLINQSFVFGICLGHQLLWSEMGAEVSHCREPVHGQKHHYNLDQTYWSHLFKQDSITVQRYNSLAVRFDDEELKKKADHLYWCQNELIMSKGNSFLTYQFHPESVGTTYPETFFKPLSALLI